MGLGVGQRRVGTGVAAALCFLAVGVAAAPTSVTSAVAIKRIDGQRVQPGYAETVRLAQLVEVSGVVARAPPLARVRLQGRLSTKWRALLTAPVHAGHFTVRWRVRRRVSQLRAVLLSGRHQIATSPVAPLLVGSAIVPCRPARAPGTLPSGYGWIAGGVYLLGGPAPGLDECQSAPSTITATSVTGSTSLRQRLTGGTGYALVLPAGTYDLKDGACAGHATVIAGRRTTADTNCDFP